MASNAKNVSIWWRHHVSMQRTGLVLCSCSHHSRMCPRSEQNVSTCKLVLTSPWLGLGRYPENSAESKGKHFISGVLLYYIVCGNTNSLLFVISKIVITVNEWSSQLTQFVNGTVPGCVWCILSISFISVQMPSRIAYPRKYAECVSTNRIWWLYRSTLVE